LIAVVGASNELPEGEELDALFDRFLLRYHVGPVSKEGFRSLLELQGEPVVDVPSHLALTEDDLSAIRKAVASVAVPGDVIALLSDLRDWCAAEKIMVSDRRWRKLVKLLQTSALTNGRIAVSIWDCWLLQHCVWNTPEQRARVFDWYAARAGASAAMDPSRLTRIVVSWEARLNQDQNSRSQVRDAEGNLVFKGVDGSPTTNSVRNVQRRRGGQALFLAPADSSDRYTAIQDRTNANNGYTLEELDRLYTEGGHTRFAHWSSRDQYVASSANWMMEELDHAPLMEPTRQKQAHVDACLAEIARLRGEVETYREKLHAHISSLETDIRNHLWVTADFVEPAARSLDGTRREVDTLLGRIEKLRQGFELLPREI
jgi:MoxR-like ATPase